MIYIVIEEYKDYYDYVNNMVCACFSREKAEEIKVQKEKEIELALCVKSEINDLMDKWKNKNPHPEYPFSYEEDGALSNEQKLLKLQYNKDYIDWSIKHQTYLNELSDFKAKEHNIKTNLYSFEYYSYRIEEIEVI